MYLYPYKIFAPSKKYWDPDANNGEGKMKKLLFNSNNYNKVEGIYSVEKLSYREVLEVKEKYTDSYISVLLGEVKPGVYLGCLDLDHCKSYDGTSLEPETKELLKEFNDNEWEWSQSGDGIHIYYLTRQKFETCIVKDIAGCKSFEWYCDKRHILSTNFDFYNTDLQIGKHDDFLLRVLEQVNNKKEQEEPSLKSEVMSMFEGQVIKDVEQFQNSIMTGRTPVTSMDVLRKCCTKDTNLRELIDAFPEQVDQSQHDAKLLRKLCYYALSFEGAYTLAKKTNYYKNKDARHQAKFNDSKYIERTRRLIGL